MSGMDDKGSTYASIDEMWQIQLQNKKSQKSKVLNKSGTGMQINTGQYIFPLQKQSQATYNGVLGGYGHLSSIDVQFSLGFILKVTQERPAFKRQSVLDCGAGIGRISRQLLCQVFKTVDMVDQCQKLVEKGKQILKDKKNMRHFYVKGLQQFQFEEKYDCVWVQWVLSHLNDEDAIKFLVKAKSALNEGGVIILKQNHCKYGFVVDKEDFSVTRSTDLFKILIGKAGLKVIKEQTQENWPQDLFGIRMYAIT